MAEIKDLKDVICPLCQEVVVKVKDEVNSTVISLLAHHVLKEAKSGTLINQGGN